MGTTELLYGPSFTSLREAAFERSYSLAEEGIRRILYIDSNDRSTAEIQSDWAERYPALTLELTTLDDVVAHCHELLFGVSETIDRQHRLRLIEQALTEIDAEGTLDGARSLVDDFSQLFADVEAAGITTPAELDDELAATALADRIREPAVEAYRRYTQHRTDLTGKQTQTRNERYTAVARSETPLHSCYPTVDVVVLADKRAVPAVEYRLIERLASEFNFIATLPAVHESATGSGADRAIQPLFDMYRTLDCDLTYVPSSETSGHSLSQRLYRNEGTELTGLDAVNWHEAPTPEREVRHIARAIRAQLATGTDPEDIAVVVPGLISYREQIADVFEAYEIPHVSYANKLIQQTYAGEAVLDVLDLCGPNPQVETLITLCENPVASAPNFDSAQLARLSRRLSTTDPRRLCAEIPEETVADRVTELLDACAAVREQDAETVIETITERIDSLGIKAAVEQQTDSGDRLDAELERQTLSEIHRILDSVAELATAGLVDEPLERIERAISDIRARAPRQDARRRVEVMGLLDARGKSFEHLYLIGATGEALPATPQRPLFFDRLDDVIPSIQQIPESVVESDPQLDARYQVATLLSSAKETQITTPESTVSDDRVLPSPVLDEVSRVSDIEPKPVRTDRGTGEDLQRSLARYETADELLTVVDVCTTNGDFEETQAARLRTGATCAANRGTAELSAHDGQLPPERVREVFTSETRSTLSPSRLKRYATCGFAYYLQRGLELETPEPINSEPDGAALGTFVHETLDRFYTALQENPGETVDLSAHTFSTLEQQLLEAGQTVESEQGLATASPFFTTWKSHLYAGLATPEANDHYDPSTTGQPAPEAAHSHRDRGFLLRFLEAEYERDTPLRPAYFEAPVGFDDKQPTYTLSLPDGESVQITGIIDRIDLPTTPGDTAATIIDYKTGSTNLKKSVEGVEFQLPLYAIAAEAGLEKRSDGTHAGSVVDAYFYDLDVPGEVSLKGPLSNRVADGPDDPAYRTFLEELTSQRIGEIQDGMKAGTYHPTVLGKREAGCKYCDYSDVCDVRHHARHDVIDHIDSSDVTAYIADRVRNVDVTARLHGSEE